MDLGREASETCAYPIDPPNHTELEVVQVYDLLQQTQSCCFDIYVLILCFSFVYAVVRLRPLCNDGTKVIVLTTVTQYPVAWDNSK